MANTVKRHLTSQVTNPIMNRYERVQGIHDSAKEMGHKLWCEGYLEGMQWLAKQIGFVFELSDDGKLVYDFYAVKDIKTY